MIHSNEPKPHTLFTCPQLSANLLFLSQNPIWDIASYFDYRVSLGYCWFWPFLRLPLFSMISPIWGWLVRFCRKSLSCELSAAFSHDQTGNVGLGWVKCHSQPILSRAHPSTCLLTGDVDLDHLADGVTSGLSMEKGLFFPFFHTVLFGEKSLCAPTVTYTVRNSLILHSLRAEHLHKGFGITSALEICLFSAMCLFIQLWIYISMDSWIFISYFGL